MTSKFQGCLFAFAATTIFSVQDAVSNRKVPHRTLEQLDALIAKPGN